jgi:formylglycine-generating enzyme required for sulfatase activity/tRNA A-37 threonylcarbamoyl transferase component Bud32
MPGGPRVQHTAAALERFADLIARHDGGETVDFERELRSPPELAGELALLHANWQRLRGLLESVRAGASEIHSAEDEAGGRALRLDARTQGLLDLLARFRGSEPRYEVLGEIARGGMGIVLRVREKGVERELALKRMFSPEELTPELRPLRAQLLRRLLEEALVLARLDHPAIVPLHELGVDAEGRAYFTMPLVRGRTLAEIFVLAREGREGWSVARALGLLQRICEALSFAHSLGIVHRDLKPANVMVGRFGELQVMDWGLARSQQGPRLGAESLAAGPGALDGDAALTLGGDVLGTPAYMAPEQALGQSAEVCPRSDVYALGAMLYELLAGTRPYQAAGSSTTARALLEQVKAGPPRAIEEQAPDRPPELLAICRKAMQREREQRYASMQELADDLRDFREGRVVRALESGAWAELRKWIGRNRRVAAALGFGLVSLLAAAAVTLWINQRADVRVRFESDRRGPAALRARAQQLWPARPERIGEIESWLAEARELVAHAVGYRAELGALRARARKLERDDPYLAAAGARRQGQLADVEREILGIDDELGQLERRPEDGGVREARAEWQRRRALAQQHQARLAAQRPDGLVFRFDDPADQARHDSLAALIDELEPLLDARPFGNTIADVEQRLERARTLGRRSLEEHAQQWTAACASIADERQCPLYKGLQLRPQLGLVPIGRDEQSGLWEFAALESGTPPERGADGRVRLEAASAIVFVLVPGGWSYVGGIRPATLPAHGAVEEDPDAPPQELPSHSIRLDPFFLSKYELTQGQWLRLTGENPSYNSVGKRFGGPTADLCYPVEHVSWFEAKDVLARFGLLLPGEWQWEHAARAGTWTRYWWGADEEGACTRTNCGGCPVHGPLSLRADSYGPNPWGFYCILGNVGEWTADNYWTSYRWDYANDGSGRQLAPDSGLRVVRGGSYGSGLNDLRVSFRLDSPPNQPSSSFGLRPLRPIDPTP